jgi:hypothetical protein
MLPTPPRHNYWLALIGCCLLAMGVWSVLSRKPSIPNSETPVQAIPPPSLAPPVSDEKTTRLGAVSSQVANEALARAIAALGQQQDGHAIDLSALDEATTSQIEPARILLASVPRQTAPGLPMRLPDGSVMRMGPDKKNAQIEPLKTSEPVRDTNARLVDGHLIPRRLDQSGRVPIPMRGDVKKDLVEPDAWIAIPYDPHLTAGQPLEIVNRSGGKYAVSLNADDFSSVRLNGGMVVPGRFYKND